MPIPGYTQWIIDPKDTCHFCLMKNVLGFKYCSTCGEENTPDSKPDYIIYVDDEIKPLDADLNSDVNNQTE